MPWDPGLDVNTGEHAGAGGRRADAQRGLWGLDPQAGGAGLLALDCPGCCVGLWGPFRAGPGWGVQSVGVVTAVAWVCV